MPVSYDDYITKPGLEIEYSQSMIQELDRCNKDRMHFIKTHIKIVTGDYGVVNFGSYMFPFQEALIKDFINHRFTVNLCGRQQGKTTVVGAYVLSYACFESHKTIGIVSNKEDSAKSFLARIKYMYEQLPAYLKPGVIRWAEKSVEFDNHCKIMIAATSKDSFRGEPINCLTGDAKVCYINDNDELFFTTIQKATSSETKYNQLFNINDKGVEFMNISDDKKYYTVYRVTNKINNMIYVGFHSTNDLDDGYLGSGKYLKRAVEKYGPESFTKEYIDIFDNKVDAELLERSIVNVEFVNRSDTYNLSVGDNVCILYGENNGFYGKHHTKETLDKIQKTRGTYNHTDETKALLGEMSKKFWDDDNNKKRMSEVHKGRVVSDETKKKMSEIMTGRKLSDETRKKLSDGKKEMFKNFTDEEYEEWYNKSFTKERSEKISKALTGRKIPVDIVNKVNKNPEKIRKTAETHRGMKRSEQARKNISEAMKGKIAPSKGMIHCYNTVTLEKLVCKPEDIPIGWKRGFIPKCKS